MEGQSAIQIKKEFIEERKHYRKVI